MSRVALLVPRSPLRRLVIFGWMLVASPASHADLVISEFLASGRSGITDGFNSTPDWIEIQNTGPTATDLAGWHLTDNPANLTQWTFPPTPIGAGKFVIVFASGRGVIDPAGYRHCNFRLNADGEYLALVRPDGTNIASAFAEPHRQQVANVSYGIRGAAGFATLLADDAPVRVLVPVDDSLGTNWVHAAFDDSAWIAGRSPTGFEDSPENYAALIQTNVRDAMRGKNTACYLRQEFTVDDPAALSNARLRINYDDGFFVWINGRLVATRNAPAAPVWNAAATANHPDTDALVAEEIPLADADLRAGRNVVAILGLNQSLTSSDFLIRAIVEAQPRAVSQPVPAYFTTPTPGAANIGGVTSLGPIIEDVQHLPARPTPADPIVITAKVSRALAPVARVALRYVVQFGAETELAMLDDGGNGDGLAGDGVFGAILPAGTAAPGQMLRYFVTTADTAGDTSRAPLFLNPLDGEQYFGTVIDNPAVASKLPVVQLFVSTANLSRIDGETGGRVSLFYDGEFYDNVLMEVRGNTTAGCNKKSHRLEFSREHPFRPPGHPRRLRKTSFMADYADPSYLRQHLSFWMAGLAGLHAPYYDPVRLQMNGQFYQLAYHSDVMGEEQLDRFGLDPNGALYKACGVVVPDGSSTGGFQKKTREWEGTQDYVQLANALATSVPVAQRRTNLFDLFDLPPVINYLAVARIVQEEDDIWANMTLYRDSDGDREWRIIPFDMNLSWGQIYGSGSVQSTSDGFKSHPLYGNSRCIQAGGPFGSYNRLYDTIIAVPETRQMLLRRMRTIMDRFVQPPGTDPLNLVIEKHIQAMTNAFWPEAFLDRAKWGWPVGCGPYGFGSNLWLTNGVNSLQNQFITPRRRHLFATHSITNSARVIGIGNTNNAGIPLSQRPNVAIAFGAIDFNPTSTNQDEEYIELVNSNAEAVDLSGWRLKGGIEHDFAGGTVLPAGGSLFLSPSPAAFRARTGGPRGGQARFVHGPYRGRLSARGETLRLLDDTGREVSTFTYVGNPSPAQRWLKLTEIHYHPAEPAAGSAFVESEFEFIELKNTGPTTLDLKGVRFTEGIQFDFTTSAITQLGAGETVLVVHNPAAFAERYGSGFRIAGAYTGLLDNGGERIRLLDAVNEEIVDLEYQPSWATASDGSGPSLENVAWDKSPADGANWRASSVAGGTPGLANAPATILSWRVVAGSHLELVFEAEPATPYVLEFATRSGGPWTQDQVKPAGPGGPATLTTALRDSPVVYLRLAIP